MGEIATSPQERRAVVNDHVWMISAQRRIKKAVPCWQIEDWIKKGIFTLEIAHGNRVGWDFKDHAEGVKDFTEWRADQGRLRAERRLRQQLAFQQGPQPADPGIAGAAAETFRRGYGSEFTQPPDPDADAGEDEPSKPISRLDILPGPSQAPGQGKRATPKDVIEEL